MVVFPNAKINLGLQILSKRQDGYHEIATCFYPVPLCDILEIVPAETFRFTSTGLDIPGENTSNLCIRAYELLREKSDLPPVHIHLHKVIPMGAGLGGGSSDGAFTLRVLNDMFPGAADQQTLEALAAKLGSDCPFFLQSAPMLASGTGTDLHPAGLSLSGTHIAVIHPGIHVSTAEAYAGVTPRIPTVSLPDILADKSRWRKELINDFEASVTSRHPEIKELINMLYEKGAWYAAMSGSGSAVYGLFDDDPALTTDYFTFTGQLD